MSRTVNRWLPATLILLLAGCGTPQEQCIAAATRDLRVVDRLIAETEGNLARGYAYQEVTVIVPSWEYCYPPAPLPSKANPRPERPPPRLCLEDRAETVRRPKAIDLAAEQRKLDGLVAKRRDLARSAATAIAACKKANPEG